MYGAKQVTEAADFNYYNWSGRGAFYRSEFDREDRCVAYRSENAGISNEKIGEIPVRRKSKVSVRSDHPLRVSRYLSRGQLE